MANVLVLGASGGGKSTSIGNIPELGIKGLNPKETFIIACTNKGLPFRGWKKLYTPAKVNKNITTGQFELSSTGNYMVTNNGDQVAALIKLINDTRSDIINIIIDDANYVMQDYYMTNAVKGGYDVFKKIGLFMGKIFNAIQSVNENKNVFMLAHFEEYKSKNDDRMSFRFKTVGKMTQDYITPEGKFEIVLFADQQFDDNTKTVKKIFVTNYDGDLPAKSPVGMFDSIIIPNDLGYVLDKINEYNTGEPVKQ